jgi:hypothetical protein
MSSARTTTRLLGLYPAAWRERYGEELAELITQTSDGGSRVPLRTQLDVALAGTRERLRAAGVHGHGAPETRMRGGVLLVLCAWALMVVAGFAVQRSSEHWQSLMPSGHRSVPSAAFVVLVVAAALAAVAVVVGIALTLSALRVFLRDGGWEKIRRRVLTAVALSGLAIAATAALVAWAHGLTDAERNGHDATYAVAFVAWVLLLAGTLAAWTAAAVSTAHRLQMSAALLRVETALAGGVATAMFAVTAATAVWWASVADAAPRFGATAQLGVALAAMALATLLAAIGARRAVLAGRAPG